VIPAKDLSLEVWHETINEVPYLVTIPGGKRAWHFTRVRDGWTWVSLLDIPSMYLFKAYL
jgi:hypothetical protein